MWIKMIKQVTSADGMHVTSFTLVWIKITIQL